MYLKNFNTSAVLSTTRTPSPHYKLYFTWLPDIWAQDLRMWRKRAEKLAVPPASSASQITTLPWAPGLELQGSFHRVPGGNEKRQALRGSTEPSVQPLKSNVYPGCAEQAAARSGTVRRS